MRGALYDESLYMYNAIHTHCRIHLCRAAPYLGHCVFYNADMKVSLLCDDKTAVLPPSPRGEYIYGVYSIAADSTRVLIYGGARERCPEISFNKHNKVRVSGKDLNARLSGSHSVLDLGAGYTGFAAARRDARAQQQQRVRWWPAPAPRESSSLTFPV
ncbi:unnamed protein product [Trichogramma brassicae]|uniref:Uncharacterized protein n=1 Tax=Trichogramma brassicae TaxID=86971 RepID=A0A6H5IGL0_9HYME|nr:unnamed protein product [Trichogramma brassicae]